MEPDLLRQAGYTLDEGYWRLPSGQQSFAASSFFLPTIAHEPLWEQGDHDLRRPGSARSKRLRMPCQTGPGPPTTTGPPPHQVVAPTNCTAVAFDALASAAATAVMGKAGENHGDLLKGSLTRRLPTANSSLLTRGLRLRHCWKTTSCITHHLERFQCAG